MSAQKTIVSSNTLSALPDELATILRELIAEHETLLALTREHREALSQANLAALNGVITRQNETVQRISTIEHRRAALVAEMTRQRAAGTSPNQPVTIVALVAHAPELARKGLLTLANTLRDLLNRLHIEHQALRLAAEMLAQHMDGLMRQVYSQLSHAGTYARSGSVDASVRVVSALDVRS